MSRVLRLFLLLVGAVVVCALLIQLVPVPQTNPAAVTNVKWDSTQTQDLFMRACADCHSNLTLWPWWTKVAPGSWLVYRDVTEGRQRFNISDLSRFDTSRTDRFNREIGETIQRGSMPPWYYVILHPNAALSGTEKQQLSDGLQKTLQQSLASK